MKKTLIIMIIVFLSTILIPLISLSNVNTDISNNTTTQTQSTSKSESTKNELVTIFNDSIS